MTMLHERTRALRYDWGIPDGTAIGRQHGERVPMKIQLASDLHLEFLEKRFPGECIIEAAPSADLLVLAGDIHNGTKAVAAFAVHPSSGAEGR